MKARHKYLCTPLIYFLLFLFLAVAYMLSGYIVNGVFEFLCEALPSLFKSQSFISNPDGYNRQLKAIAVLTAVLALLGVNYLSLLLDNKRLEYIAKATEGRYTLSFGMGFYLKSFWLADVITAVIPPMLLAIPVYFVPEAWYEYGARFPMMTSLELCTLFGFLEGVIILTAISLLTRLLSAPIALLRWRAAWLSGTAEVI